MQTENKQNKSIIERIAVISIISGTISGILVLLLFLYVLCSAWFFFIIPLTMGLCIKKFSKIKASHVEEDENLQKKVGWICAGMTFFFVIVAGLIATIAIINMDQPWTVLFLNIPFIGMCIFSIYFGYTQGVKAVTDAYFDDMYEEE